MNQEFEIISHSQMNFKLFLVNMLYRTPHIHKDFELGLLLDGSLFLQAQNETHSLETGDFFVVNPFQSHELKADSPALLVSLQVHPSFFSSYYPRIANLEFTSLILQRDGTDVRKKLYDMMIELACLYLKKADKFELKCVGLLNLLFAGLLDTLPNINDYTEEEIKEKARTLKKMLDKYGLAAEFVAPRLWMDGRTADGGFMSTSEEDREYAMWRAYRSIDIAKELGCNMVVLWLAREGTLCAESKSPVWATKMLIQAINKMLEYDSDIRICIEPKPNEPIDRSICGTMGHVLAVSAATIDPGRVGGNLESAHAILAGLDPAHEIGFAMAMGKLMTVHLNDQNGIKYDQDKAFGVENLRAAFNQVKVLKENGYGENGEYVGLDVKAMRTTRDQDSYKHLENSLNIFKALEEKADRFDYEFQKECVRNRDFEGLEMYVMNLLMGLV